MQHLLVPVARLLLGAGLVYGASAFVVSANAFAQSDDDDDLDDILGSDDAPTTEETEEPEEPEETVAEEKRDVLAGDVGDSQTSVEPVLETPEERRRIRPIKVLQPKSFLKMGRFEVAPGVGFVTNDPFVNVFLINASAAYHATEILAIEINGIFSPIAPYKPITNQLVDENQVSPDVSRIVWAANANLMFSPIYGKVAVGDNGIIIFDIFGVFGTGIVQTQDDLEALQRPEDPVALATQTQIHPTSNFGGGVRVGFGHNIAVRVEGRSMIYIETVASTTLELKNAFMLLGNVSFFFPGMK